MKTSQGQIFKRREKIIAKLKSEGVVYVDNLAKAFHVSPLTIRRDLSLFEKKKMVKREYGKAIYIKGTIHNEQQITLRSIEQRITDDKIALAKYASKFVKDGMTIYVNAGVTALLFILEISDMDVVIFTNNTFVHQFVSERSASIYLTGGEITANNKALIGDVAIQTLTSRTADLCVLETEAIDEEMVSSNSLSETLIDRTMIEYTAGHKIVIAEQSKIGKRNNFMTTHTNMMSHIITTAPKQLKQLQAMEKQGVKLCCMYSKGTT